MSGAEKRFAPASARNQEPILEALRQRLPETGRALEIASGTGQHVAAFAAAFPGLDWQPSDPDPDARSSIVAWTEHAGVKNVRPPLAIDVTRGSWWSALKPGFDVVVAVNLLHIAPWEATCGLCAGAAALLSGNGLLAVYGAFARDGALIPESNVAFDADLRRRNPAWGVRDTRAVSEVAAKHGLTLADCLSLPANNLMLIFRRT